MTDEERAEYVAHLKRERVKQGLSPTYAGRGLELLASAMSRHPSTNKADKKSAA